jgi:hypothetical protein
MIDAQLFKKNFEECQEKMKKLLSGESIDEKPPTSEEKEVEKKLESLSVSEKTETAPAETKTEEPVYQDEY